MLLQQASSPPPIDYERNKTQRHDRNNSHSVYLPSLHSFLLENSSQKQGAFGLPKGKSGSEKGIHPTGPNCQQTIFPATVRLALLRLRISTRALTILKLGETGEMMK